MSEAIPKTEETFRVLPWVQVIFWLVAVASLGFLASSIWAGILIFTFAFLISVSISYSQIEVTPEAVRTRFVVGTKSIRFDEMTGVTLAVRNEAESPALELQLNTQANGFSRRILIKPRSWRRSHVMIQMIESQLERRGFVNRPSNSLDMLGRSKMTGKEWYRPSSTTFD